MRKLEVFSLLGLAFVFVISGCTVRTYPLTRDRVDQDLASGNRGYVLGTAPTQEELERQTTRQTRVFEIELGRPVKVEPKKKATSEYTTESTEGNRGYITESTSPEIAEPMPEAGGGNFKQYRVKKNDTLQKISQKFYGTTKNWMKIYEVNKDVLKGPNKVYPGQTLNIPAEGIKETTENLK